MWARQGRQGLGQGAAGCGGVGPGWASRAAGRWHRVFMAAVSGVGSGVWDQGTGKQGCGVGSRGVGTRELAIRDVCGGGFSIAGCGVRASELCVWGVSGLWVCGCRDQPTDSPMCQLTHPPTNWPTNHQPTDPPTLRFFCFLLTPADLGRRADAVAATLSRNLTWYGGSKEGT